MAIYNIPVNENIIKVFTEYILTNHSCLSPNFSRILVLVPSYEFGNNLKIEFARKSIIMPKIVALAVASLSLYIIPRKEVLLPDLFLPEKNPPD